MIALCAVKYPSYLLSYWIFGKWDRKIITWVRTQKITNQRGLWFYYKSPWNWLRRKNHFRAESFYNNKWYSI